MNSDFLFIKLYIMLGDADGSIRGIGIIPKEEWEKEVREFNEYLEKKSKAYIEADSVWGVYRMDLQAYTIQNCTAAEAEVLKKFLGETQGEFKFPSVFIDEALDADD